MKIEPQEKCKDSDASEVQSDCAAATRFVRNSTNCYLRHIGSQEKCPWMFGVEGGFCQHPQCSADDFY